jgi:hypothetical protein
MNALDVQHNVGCLLLRHCLWPVINTHICYSRVTTVTTLNHQDQ